jgi:hypothetical protein
VISWYPTAVVSEKQSADAILDTSLTCQAYISKSAFTFNLYRYTVALHFAFEGAKVLHDALDGMSADSDRREAALLATKLVRAAQFGRDYEQHLNFLVSCRSGFAALSAVQEVVVLQAARWGLYKLNAVDP